MGSPRKLKITYGTYTVGDDAQSAILDGGYSETGTYEQTTISFAALIFASNDTNMAIKVQAFEAAFSTPRSALQITQGAAILAAADPATNSGFDAVASFQKDQHAADTGLSRRYLVTIVVQRPASLAGQSGRRNASVSIAYDASDRILVTFQGQYTALGGNDALAQFNSAFPTYASGVLAGITGTFEKVSKSTQLNDTTKTCDYTVAYREILWPQTAGQVDDANIVDHTVTFTTSLEAPGDWGPGTVRLTDIVATYNCNVLKGYENIEALWSGALRAYVIASVKETFNPTAIAVEAESPSFNKTQNRITATLRFKAAIGVGGLIKARVKRHLHDSLNPALTPVWDGQEFSKHVDQGPSDRIRTTTKVWTILGNKDPIEFIGSVASSGAGWIFLTGDSDSDSYYIGIGGEKILVTDYTEVTVETYVTKPKSKA